MKLEGWLLANSKIRSLPKAWELHAAHGAWRCPGNGAKCRNTSHGVGRPPDLLFCLAVWGPAELVLSPCLPSPVEVQGLWVFVYLFLLCPPPPQGALISWLFYGWNGNGVTLRIAGCLGFCVKRDVTWWRPWWLKSTFCGTLSEGLSPRVHYIQQGIRVFFLPTCWLIRWIYDGRVPNMQNEWGSALHLCKWGSPPTDLFL